MTAGDESAISAPLGSVCRVAADGANHIYGAQYSGASVTKLDGISDPAGALIEPGGETLAVNPANNDLFVDRGSSVAQYDQEGNLLGTFGGARLNKSAGIAALGSTGEIFVVNGETKRVDVFGPSETAKPIIESESVSTTGATEAILRAKVNPNGVPTTLYAEYGTDTGYGQKTAEQPIGDAEKSLNIPIPLKNLAPGVTYHFRIVVEAEGTSIAGPDRTLRTYASGLETDCGNQAFRTGASSRLPDCRAYEMVSPVDKNGNDIATNYSGEGSQRASIAKAAFDGSAMTYSAGAAFADQPNSTGANQYLSLRTAEGWSTQGLNLPPVPTLEAEPGVVNVGAALDPAYRHFSANLSEAWLNDFSVTPRTADGAVGVPNLYRRDLASGTLHALTNQTPPEPASEVEYPFELEGVTPDGTDVMFTTASLLTGDAFPSQVNPQTYLASGGNLRLVSVTPNGEAYRGASNLTGRLSSDGASAYWRSGSSTDPRGAIYLRQNPGRPQSSLANGAAVGRVEGFPSGVTELKVENITVGEFRAGQELWSLDQSATLPFQPHTTITSVGTNSLTISKPTVAAIGGSLSVESVSPCIEAGKACTIRVSEAVPGGNQSHLYAISESGDKAFFVVEGTIEEGGNNVRVDNALYEFNQSADTYHLMASKVTSVVGASSDGSRLYAVSKEALDPGATAGAENLYLFADGSVSFIATLAQGDVDGNFSRGATSIGGKGAGTGFATANAEYLRRGSRITPDGGHLLFMSESSQLSERVAGYSNVDLINGERDREVYLYSLGSGLRCISCNPSGAQPVGQRLEPSFNQTGFATTDVWAAAWIPGEEHELLAQRVLSDDGGRVFFNSFDALVPSDGNGAQDVYEWEMPGVGRCREGSSSFSPQDGGCISLISSGESPARSEFVDASGSGSDVFFTTASSLVPQDIGLVDVYDARVDGGFPPPQGRAAACEGEACQGVIVPPNDTTPSSATYNGPANVKAAKKAHRKKNHVKKKHRKHRKSGKRASSPKNSTRRVGA